MSRFVLVLTILVATLAACGSVPTQPSQPSATPPVPGTTAPPTSGPSPEAPAPTDRPTPSPELTPRPTGSPAVLDLTVEERYLLDGIRRGAIDCHPRRDDLPRNAIAGIECASDDPVVARVGFFLFDTEADLLAAYFARMDAEGVKRDSVACLDEEGESPYIPGEEETASRHGCFVNAEGYANYRATMPGFLIYVGVLGRTSDMRSLEAFAWRGNQDLPGMPTLWTEP
jgi:hypothetical protein